MSDAFSWPPLASLVLSTNVCELSLMSMLGQRKRSHSPSGGISYLVRTVTNRKNLHFFSGACLKLSLSLFFVMTRSRTVEGRGQRRVTELLQGKGGRGKDRIGELEEIRGDSQDWGLSKYS